MLIVLEGPDYAGKSTLAQLLVDIWTSRWPLTPEVKKTAEIIHCGPPGDKPDDRSDAQWGYEVSQSLLDTINIKHTPGDENHLVVLDRYHIGMPVYGPLFRPQWNRDNYGDIGYLNFMWIESQLNRHGALTVHMATPLKTLIERSFNREDEYLDTRDISREKQLEEIWVRYYQFFAYVGQFMPTNLGYPIFSEPYEFQTLKRIVEDDPKHFKTPWPEPYKDTLLTYATSNMRPQWKSAEAAAGHLLSQAIHKNITRPHSEYAFRFNHSNVEAVN